MIKNMTHQDILEAPFKWGEHVWVEIPLEGGQAALDYQEDYGDGYGLLKYLDEEDEFLDVSGFPAAKTTGVESIGDIVSVYDEDRRIWFHGVYTHSIEAGWAPNYYETDQITRKLDEWWAEHEEEVVWPMRAQLFGHGRFHQRVGHFRADAKAMLAFQANSEAQFALFWLD